MKTVVQVKNLTTKIQGNVLHEKLSFQIMAGQIFAIVGGSGSGKSVLFRVLLGLMKAYSGDLYFWDQKVYKEKEFDHLYRKIGVMFQSGALFSSLTVLENVCLSLLEKGNISKKMAEKLAFMRLDMVGLSQDTAYKRPSELSGGMIKRVALARALSLDAELLFLDEPTAGLDPIAAQGFDTLLQNLQKHLGLTVIMITHDIDTLHAISDQIGVLVDKAMIVGTLQELHAHPHPWIQDYFSGKRGHMLREGK